MARPKETPTTGSADHPLISAEPSIEQPAFAALLNYFADSGRAHAPTHHADSRIDDDITEHDSLRAAAVLIAVSRPAHQAPSRIILTLRSEKLRSHSGQVSLPGGSCDSGDVDATATALREAEEEIGLPRSAVEILGQMGEIALPSGFRITPVVGLIEPGLELTPCPHEVASIFHPPLELLMTPTAYSRSTAHYRGAERTILELPYEGYRIWGATAAILYSLAQRLQN